jgi:hypothetical protein
MFRPVPPHALPVSAAINFALRASPTPNSKRYGPRVRESIDHIWYSKTGSVESGTAHWCTPYTQTALKNVKEDGGQISNHHFFLPSHDTGTCARNFQVSTSQQGSITRSIERDRGKKVLSRSQVKVGRNTKTTRQSVATTRCTPVWVRVALRTRKRTPLSHLLLHDQMIRSLTIRSLTYIQTKC